MKKICRCVDCMYCIWVDKGADSNVLFCENEMTKDGDEPIGFLDEKADACKYFSDAGVSVFASGSLKIC